VKLRGRLRSAIHRIWPPKPRPLILGYHRIADEVLDPWALAVSPSKFEEHLEVIKRTRRPLTLRKFVRELLAGTLPSDAVSLTFDDGYVDNLTAGKPRLTKSGIPATFFLVSGYLNRSGEFWWDELARLVLTATGPSNFTLAINGESIRVDLEAGSTRKTAQALPRGAALTTLFQYLRRLNDKERESIMHKLRSIFANDGKSPSGRAMTTEEVAALASDGLVTIGAHTVTHPLLPELTLPDCRHEIKESKIACEALSRKPVIGFAYPFGKFDAKAREEVKSAGFSFACSTQYGPAKASSDLFALPRIHVQNWDGDSFERAIRSAAAG
jgi:peptidoglycan/xylan/chitin deacetylase (PgdA/CDA1 family)